MTKNAGHPQTLVRSHPENTNAVKHRVYSDRLREPRAREIAEQVMSAPWASELDELGALELGRLEALIESLDETIKKSRGKPKRDHLNLRLRATKELREWLTAFGMTAHSRASWAAALGRPTLGAEIARRSAERNGNA